jgi:hypothetical protein
MLVRNIPTIQKSVEVQKGSGFDRFAPHLSDVETGHIVPLVGAALYAELDAFVTAGSTTPPEKAAVVTALQAAAVHLMFAERFDIFNSKATDSGFVRFSGEGQKDLYVGQERRLRRMLVEKGNALLDAATRLIESNAASFAAYERAVLEGCFVQRTAEFNFHWDIRASRFLFLQTVAAQRSGNEMHLREVMKETYDVLLQAVADDSVEGLQVELLKLARRASVFAALVEGGALLVEKLTDRSFSVAGTMPSYDMRDDMQGYSAEMLQQVLKDAQQKLDRALKALKDYLVANAVALGYTPDLAPMRGWDVRNDLDKTYIL